MPLMTSFFTAISGLHSSQTAINITAHNLANVNTDGYVRQQAQFSEQEYKTYGYSAINTMQIGYGVNSARTQHYRDILLDKAYREESGRQEYYAAQYETIEEIESIFGELNGEAFQSSLKELWSAINEVVKTPDSTEARASLVMNAEAFINRSVKIYDSFTDYQDRINDHILLTIDEINQIGDEIVALNSLIQSVEAVGVEQAMDYRDQRDLLLDELAGLIDIQYTEDEDGMVTVRAEGQEFVTKGGCFHIGTAELNKDEHSNYVTPVWPQFDNAKVFNFSVEISTAEGNDTGELKSLVLARGGYNATYQDIPHEPVKPDMADFTKEDGTTDMEAYEAAIDKYWAEDYAAYEEEVIQYDRTVGNSVMMRVEAMFDQLINGLTTTINDILCPDKQTTLAAGTELTLTAGTVYNQLSDEMKQALQLAGITEADFNEQGVADEDITFTLQEDVTVRALDMDETSYGEDENNTPGTELFSRSDTLGRYSIFENADGEKIYVYNEYNQFGTSGNYSIHNIEINNTVLEEYSYLPFTTKEGETDMQLGQKILDAWEQTFTNLNPDNLTPKNFTDYYDALIGLVASDGSVYKTIAESEGSVVASLDDARESFFGVSSNDELANLITFQNAYNANSRYMNVISDMLDTLIHKVGHW